MARLSFALYLIFFLIFSFLISACGKEIDLWELPLDSIHLSELSILELHEKSILGELTVLLEPDPTSENIESDQIKLRAIKEKIGNIGYFESEIIDVTEREDAKGKYDVWVCINKPLSLCKNEDADPKYIMIKYGNDKGPTPEVGLRIKWAGIFQGTQSKARIIGGESYRRRLYEWHPQFTLIRSEILK